MKGDSNFFNLLKATRVERTLIPISFIMIAVAFADKINVEVFILAICCILIYVSGGILNAKIDGDYMVKSSIIVPLLILITLIISLVNKIIFFTVVLWVILSFIYNKYSRRILFGDSVLLSLTHAAIAAISASILLDLNLEFSVYLGIFVFSSFLLLVPMKNLNGVKGDIEKKYKTLMTQSRDGKILTYVLFNFYLISMFLSYFVFDLGDKFLFVFSLILMVKISMDYFIYNGKEVLTYKLARLIILLFSFAFVFDQATNINVVLLSFIVMLSYLIYLVNDTRQQVKQGRLA